MSTKEASEAIKLLPEVLPDIQEKEIQKVSFVKIEGNVTLQALRNRLQSLVHEARLQAEQQSAT